MCLVDVLVDCFRGSIFCVVDHQYIIHISCVEYYVLTVYSAPEDGRKGRPKHVEQACQTCGPRAACGPLHAHLRPAQRIL